jgi:hypothetical protein
MIDKLIEENLKQGARIIDLERAIHKHRSQTGNNLCWENDLELWQILEGSEQYPHDTLPPEQEFLRNCKKYYDSRKN